MSGVRYRWQKPMDPENTTADIILEIKKRYSEGGTNMVGYTLFDWRPFKPLPDQWRMRKVTKAELKVLEKSKEGFRKTTVIVPEFNEAGDKTGMWEIWTTWFP